MKLSKIAIGSTVCAVLFGCSSPATESEALSVTQQAANVCNETVPTNRAVDGIPAYAQCTTTTGAIYSNNGVDTDVTSGGTGWVRTQTSGGYQCTELAHRYLYFHWNVTWLPTGNAGTWCDTAPPATSGVVQTTTPVHGDLIVFAPGSCGADATTGHVALVDVVVSATTVTIVEENSAGRRNSAVSCAKCFLHVTANTGAGGASSVGGASSTGGSLAAMGGLASIGGSRATGGVGGLVGFGGALGTGGAQRPGTGGQANTGGANATGGAAVVVNTFDSTGGTSSATSTVDSEPSVGGTSATGTTAPLLGASTNEAPDGNCSCGVPGHAPSAPVAIGLGLMGTLGLCWRRRSREAQRSRLKPELPRHYCQQGHPVGE